MSILPQQRPTDDKKGHAQFQLWEEIIALSVANTWHEARLEWELDGVYMSDEPGTCLCGHYPIREHCVLRNCRNGEEVVVGNVCVNKFMDMDTGPLFTAFNRIRKNIEAALNVEAIEHAYAKGWFTPWEYGFYIDTYKKRNWKRVSACGQPNKISPGQLTKRVQINQKVLARLTSRVGRRA
jgi:hypothetical protein